MRRSWTPGAPDAVVIALAGSVVLGSHAASAHTEPAPRPVATITIAGSGDDLDVFMEAMREPLEALGLALRGARARAEETATGDRPTGGGLDATAGDGAGEVRVWVDARHEDHVEVLIAAGRATGPGAIRRVIPRDPSRSRAVVAEDVAYAVRATLESLLEPPPPAPVPPAAPPPPYVPPPRFGLDVAAFGSVRGFADGLPLFGGAVVADLALWGRGRFRPVLWAVVAFDASVTRTTPEVSLETTLYSLRAVPAVELLQAGPLRLAAGAGFGVDFLRADPSQADITPIAIRPATTYADPIVEAQVMLRARLADRVGLSLAVAADYDLGPHYFSEFDQSGVQGDVLVPWRVRPAVYLGVCFRAAGGASGCAGSP